MKKIIIIFLFFPLISFAKKEWPWIPLKNTRSVSIGEIHCPATLQCNFDYHTKKIPCINSEDTKYWNKKTTIKRDSEKQSGVISVPFILVCLEHSLSNEMGFEKERFTKAMCLYSLGGNNNYYNYTTIQSIDGFSFERAQNDPAINPWFTDKSNICCQYPPKSGKNDDPKDCPVFLFNTYRHPS